jgi:hypothetical protein
MSKPGNRPASNNSASVTVDTTNLDTMAAAPIGREIDRRVDPIVAAVLACPQVAGLHSGRNGQAVTYLPGRRITGIRITVDEVAIHVVARYPAVIKQVADQIRRAVAPLAGGLRVDVAIEDLAVPGEPSSGPRPDITDVIAGSKEPKEF